MVPEGMSEFKHEDSQAQSILASQHNEECAETNTMKPTYVSTWLCSQ